MIFWSIFITAVLLSNSLIYSNPAIFQSESDGNVDEHPRLFFSNSDLQTLRDKAQTTHEEIWIPIKGFTDKNLNTAPPVSAPDKGLSTYRNYGSQLIAYAFSSVILNEAEYLDLAKTHLLTYATWKQWGENNYCDLGLAHMLFGNALAYDWLFNFLTAEEKAQVRVSLAYWAEQMYIASSGPREIHLGNWWRKSYMQNHHWTNNCAMGLVGLVLLGEDERAQKWIDYAVEQMSKIQFLLNNIADGSWHEGINYQNYGLTMMLPFLKNLKDYTNIDILPDIYLQKYPEWRIYNYLPNTIQNIFAHGDFEFDWGSSYAPQNILRFIANEYNDGHAEWMAQQLDISDGRYDSVWRAPWYVFEFFYYNPDVKAKAPLDFEKSKTFPDFTGVVWRTGWQEDDLVFAIKTGPYGGQFAYDSFVKGAYPWELPYDETGCQLNIGHDHDDTNCFYMFQAGAWLAPESEGSGKTASSLHNTILVDGQGQYRPPEYWRDPDTFSEISGFIENKANTINFNYIATDATKRYKHINGIGETSRQVLFVSPGYFIIFDNIKAEEPHSYEWITHFDESIAIEGNWIRGNASNDMALGVGILLPKIFNINTGNDGRPFARISPDSPVAKTQFVNVLYPTQKSSWDSKPIISLLDDNSAAILFQLRKQDGNEWIDEIILNRELSTAERIGHYEYNGKLAFIRRDRDKKLERIFVVGGTNLKDLSLNIDLVKSSKQITFFEANYINNTVYISGNINGQIRLYGPDIEQVLINNVATPFSKSQNFVNIADEVIPPLPPDGVGINQGGG